MYIQYQVWLKYNELRTEWDKACDLNNGILFLLSQVSIQGRTYKQIITLFYFFLKIVSFERKYWKWTKLLVMARFQKSYSTSGRLYVFSYTEIYIKII